MSDSINLKSHSGKDIDFRIDGDGDLAIETDDPDGRTQVVYVAAADVAKLREWLTSQPGESNG